MERQERGKLIEDGFSRRFKFLKSKKKFLKSSKEPALGRRYTKGKGMHGAWRTQVSLLILGSPRN